MKKSIGRNISILNHLFTKQLKLLTGKLNINGIYIFTTNVKHNVLDNILDYPDGMGILNY